MRPRGGLTCGGGAAWRQLHVCPPHCSSAQPACAWLLPALPIVGSSVMQPRAFASLPRLGTAQAAASPPKSVHSAYCRRSHGGPVLAAADGAEPPQHRPLHGVFHSRQQTVHRHGLVLRRWGGSRAGAFSLAHTTHAHRVMRSPTGRSDALQPARHWDACSWCAAAAAVREHSLTL